MISHQAAERLDDAGAPDSDMLSGHEEEEDVDAGVDDNFDVEEASVIDAGSEPAVDADTESDLDADVAQHVDADAQSNLRADVNAHVGSDLTKRVEVTADAGVAEDIEADVATVAVADVNTDVEADIDGDIEADTEAGIDADVDVETGGDAEADTEADTEADIVTDIGADTETDIEADTEAEIEAGIEGDIVADVEADIEADFEAYIEADIETDIEAGIEADAEADVSDAYHADMHSSNAEINDASSEEVEGPADVKEDAVRESDGRTWNRTDSGEIGRAPTNDDDLLPSSPHKGDVADGDMDSWGLGDVVDTDAAALTASDAIGEDMSDPDADHMDRFEVMGIDLGSEHTDSGITADTLDADVDVDLVDDNAEGVQSASVGGIGHNVEAVDGTPEIDLMGESDLSGGVIEGDVWQFEDVEIHYSGPDVAGTATDAGVDLAEESDVRASQEGEVVTGELAGLKEEDVDETRAEPADSVVPSSESWLGHLYDHRHSEASLSAGSYTYARSVFSLVRRKKSTIYPFVQEAFILWGFCLELLF